MNTYFDVIILLATLSCVFSMSISMRPWQYSNIKRLRKQTNSLQRTVNGHKKTLATLNSRLDEVLNKLDGQDTKLDAVQTKAQAGTGGGTYTRWGRTDCPTSTELVYSGYAGGSHWKHSGAAANYICLTKDPIYDYVEPGKQDAGGLAYGAEYEPYRKNPTGFVGKNMDDEDVPCAVCRSSRPSVVMIPGRNNCSSDSWTLEYKGYLSSGKISHASASEFVCLDGHPRSLSKPHANVDGKLFYFVEGRCGSLNCPPYIDGNELTCAVCSK